MLKTRLDYVMALPKLIAASIQPINSCSFASLYCTNYSLSSFYLHTHNNNNSNTNTSLFFSNNLQETSDRKAKELLVGAWRKEEIYVFVCFSLALTWSRVEFELLELDLELQLQLTKPVGTNFDCLETAPKR